MQEANSKVIDKIDADKAHSSGKNWNGKKVAIFFGDVKQEFKRIEWTSKEELRSYTKIVLASTFLFGMSIYLVDLGIQGVLKGINLLLSVLIG